MIEIPVIPDATGRAQPGTLPDGTPAAVFELTYPDGTTRTWLVAPDEDVVFRPATDPATPDGTAA